MKKKLKLFFSIIFVYLNLSVPVTSQTISIDFQSGWYIEHLQAVDMNVAWAICRQSFSSYNLKLLRRTATGEWIYCQRNGLDTNDIYYGFYAFDSSNAYIANTYDVFRTNDGGENWTPVISTWGTGFINDIIFSETDPQVGYITSDPINGQGSPAPVFKTTNGGTGWDTLFMYFPQGYYGLTHTASLYGTERLYLSDNGMPTNNSNARIHVTSNGGINWFSLTLPGSNLAYFSINFKENLMTGIVSSIQNSSTKGMKTTNAGQSWFEVHNFNNGAFAVIKPAKGSDTWYLIDSREFYKSEDDGNSWDLKYTINNGAFTTFDIAQDKDVVYGWMSGLPGTIHRFIDTVKLVSNITQLGSEIPAGYSLRQNYPNPFNPITNISYDIPEATSVRLSVYNVLGKEIAVLVNERQNAGSYSYQLSIDNYQIGSGVYFYRLEAGTFTDTKRMVIVK